MSDIVTIEGTSRTVPAFVPGGALPAYMQQATEVLGSNMPDRFAIPSLSYEGKVWQIVRNKDKQKLQTRNAEGDVVPMAVVRMVILGVAPRRGRAYYPDGYDPTKAAQPECWSSDGEAPNAEVKEPKGSICKTCPMAAKGSRITDGVERVACAQHRILAVVPGQDIASDPLRLKIALTSDWDKDNTEHGWFAFQQYMDFLKAQGIAHSGLVVTKIRFDNNTAYPKLLFGVDRFLDQTEYAQMVAAAKSPKVEEVIADKFTPAGVNGVIADQSDTRPDEGAPGKPTDPQHIAHEGTDSEIWWDGTAWVKPWLQPAASAVVIEAAPQRSVQDIAAEVVRDMDKSAAAVGPTKPTDPAHIAHAGTADELWWDGTAWIKPPVVAEASKAPPPAPVVAEAPPVRPAPVDPAHRHNAGTADELWWDGLTNAWVAPWAPVGSGAPESKLNPAVAAQDQALPDGVAALMEKWS